MGGNLRHDAGNNILFYGTAEQWNIIAECYMGNHIGGNRAPKNITLQHNHTHQFKQFASYPLT